MKRMIATLCCGAMLTAGLIISAYLLSNRPMTGSLSGSFSSSSGAVEYPDVMSIHQLQGYLGIYPSYNEIEYFDPEEEPQGDAPVPAWGPDNYEQREQELLDELIANVKSRWADFPYVELSGELYFSKQAVDEWFYTQSMHLYSVQ